MPQYGTSQEGFLTFFARIVYIQYGPHQSWADEIIDHSVVMRFKGGEITDLTLFVFQKMKVAVAVFALLAVVAIKAQDAKDATTAATPAGDRPKTFRRLIPADVLRGNLTLFTLYRTRTDK